MLNKCKWLVKISSFKLLREQKINKFKIMVLRLIKNLCKKMLQGPQLDQITSTLEYKT